MNAPQHPLDAVRPSTRPGYGPLRIVASWGEIVNTDPIVARRSGWSDSRLTVYPPGTSATEQFLLKVRRRWMLWGLAIVVLTACVVGSETPAAVSIVVGSLLALLYLAGLILVGVRTRRVRRYTRHVDVRTIAVRPPAKHFGDKAALDSVIELLAGIDTRLRSGDMTAVEHELVWARAYDLLDPAGRI